MVPTQTVVMTPVAMGIVTIFMLTFPRARPPKPSPSIRRTGGQPVTPLRLALLTG